MQFGSGQYKFQDYDTTQSTVEGIQWFEELSLYCEVLLHLVFICETERFVFGSWKSLEYHLFGPCMTLFLRYFFQEIIPWGLDELRHRTNLTAKTFAELFTLAGADLAECIRKSPGGDDFFLGKLKTHMEDSDWKMYSRMNQWMMNECRGQAFTV